MYNFNIQCCYTNNRIAWNEKKNHLIFPFFILCHKFCDFYKDFIFFIVFSQDWISLIVYKTMNITIGNLFYLFYRLIVFISFIGMFSLFHWLVNCCNYFNGVAGNSTVLIYIFILSHTYISVYGVLVVQLGAYLCTCNVQHAYLHAWIKWIFLYECNNWYLLLRQLSQKPNEPLLLVKLSIGWNKTIFVDWEIKKIEILNIAGGLILSLGSNKLLV